MLVKPYFTDTNILIYALSDEKEIPEKKERAITLLCKQPVISTQILSECSHLLRRKFKLEYKEIREILDFTIRTSKIVQVSLKTIQLAWYLGQKYGYSYFDSLVLASALEVDCQIIYSEDMQHNQLIENKLRIINPFLN